MLSAFARPVFSQIPAHLSILPQLLRYASSVASPLQVCVVGSGPAGLYTVNRLLKALGDDVNIGVIDRLPTPFGLVRSGVAPDHPDTKNVINGFSADLSDPRCSFLGNVRVGEHISVADLRKMFHCVVLAYGAESDRKLGIPGEQLKGVFSAREFVWWYNGHPDARDLPLDLSKVESVAVCGLGNVALDCARVLLRPTEELATTDLASHALQQLKTSGIKQVSVLARRGPVQAACTPKELKELLTAQGISAHIDTEIFNNVSAEDQAEMKKVRLRRRIYELLQQNCKPLGEQEASRRLDFHFFNKPVEVLGDNEGNVCGLKMEKTKLVSKPDGSSTLENTGETSVIPTQLVLKSIGYKSLPVEGVPFDSRAGIIPNEAGRVINTTSSSAADVNVTSSSGVPPSGTGAGSIPGLYVVGWLKRGPTGIIGTNLTDAQDTVNSMLSDVLSLERKEGKVEGVQGLQSLLKEKGHDVVDWNGWLSLDKVEVERGEALGKPREKVVTVGEMLQACKAAA